MKILKSPLLYLGALATVSAQAAARADASCGLLLGKIYCFGGALYTSPTESRLDNVINVLDITLNNGATAADLAKEWKTVSSDPNRVNLAIRTNPQAVALADGKRFLINGGISADLHTKLPSLNIVYNAETNAWEKYEPYSEYPYGTREIYYGTAVNVPGKGVAFYGGFEDYINTTWKVPSTDINVFNFDGNKSRTIGYTQVAYFDINNLQKPWSVPVPISTTWSNTFSAQHASVFDVVNQTLLFLGGTYTSNTPGSPSSKTVGRGYDNALTFNTLTNQWGNVSLGGRAPQGGRQYATVTLLPKTQRYALLFGGEVNAKAVLDYCFVLNLDTNMWTKQTIDAPPGTTLSRTAHSAVAVNNDTVFILWGIDGNRIGVNSILILDVSNPDAITLSENFVDANLPTQELPSAGLNKGAKIGIAVGCAVAGLLIIAGLVWFCVKRNKNKENERREELLALEARHLERQNEVQQVEPMEVDWDEIEQKYTEIPTSNFKGTKYHSPNDPTDITSAGTPTLVNSSEGQSVTSNLRSFDAGKPIPPDIGSSSPPKQNLVKPDGGF